MFGLFKSSKNQLPQFKNLEESGLKHKYFYRVASWNWLNEKNIAVFDPNNPRVITMDDWPQLIFLEADGQKTIEEFVLYMAKQYKKCPERLDDTILYEIDQLIKEGLIKLSDHSVQLDANIAGPINTNNLENGNR